MNPWPAPSKERELFDAVVDLPADDRRKFLDDNCPPELRSKVERLLAAETSNHPHTPPDLPFPLDATRSDPKGPRELAKDTAFPVLPGFEILENIGKGGMAVVYKARQLELDRIVAVKMIRSEGEATEEKVRRFRLEAKVVARIQHPNIVQIHDVGDFEGRPFLVLEFIDGGSLADRLNGKPWPARDAARLLKHLAEGIHEAHRHEIVHRDLKPGNVLLPKNSPIPKVTDFGIAKLMDTSTRQTQTGHILGTPCYMAPEQAGENKLVGPATDVYGLGATLYELLTGQPPFQGETYAGVLDQVRNREPVPPRRLIKDVPRDLETICLKCLEKNPQRRYPSAAALAEDLERFLQGQPVMARPVGFVGRSWRNLSRRPLVPLLTMALLVVMVLAVVALFWEPGRNPKEVRVGIWPYVGYAPLVVAKEMELFEGIDVKIEILKDIVDARPRLTKGTIDASVCVVDAHVHTRDQGVPAKAVLKLADSHGADAIVARKDIKGLQDLKGKKIAYVPREPPHFLLLCLCDDNKFSRDDFKNFISTAGAKEAADEFIAGRVAAAATFDPDLTRAVDKGNGHIIASSADVPGQIVDILTVNEEYLRHKPENVKALIKGWFRGLEALESRDPRALQHADKFLELEYIKAEKDVKFAGFDDNQTFFHVRPDHGSPFRDLMREAEKRWDKYDRGPNRPVSPEEADGSRILFELIGKGRYGK